MLLTPAQKATLAAHINANTNLGIIPNSGGQTFQINGAVSGRDPTLQQGIADWYNGLGLPGDNQPFANNVLWNPNTTIQQLNAAIDWTGSPVGADQPALTNAWLKWQSMCWNNAIDMSDPQVRAGVIQVWGNPSTTVTNIGAATGALCGKLNGRRIELAVSPAAVGQVVNAWAGAHVCPKGAIPANSLVPSAILGILLTASDVDTALFPNG